MLRADNRSQADVNKLVNRLGELLVAGSNLPTFKGSMLRFVTNWSVRDYQFRIRLREGVNRVA